VANPTDSSHGHWPLHDGHTRPGLDFVPSWQIGSLRLRGTT
jgi:hypothetical protein